MYGFNWKVSLLFVEIWVCFEEAKRTEIVGEQTARKVFRPTMKGVKKDRIKLHNKTW
jgi:hypothetical protein